MTCALALLGAGACFDFDKLSAGGPAVDATAAPGDASRSNDDGPPPSDFKPADGDGMPPDAALDGPAPDGTLAIDTKLADLAGLDLKLPPDMTDLLVPPDMTPPPRLAFDVPASAPAESGPIAIVALDVNSDGFSDLVVANQAGNSLSTLLNDKTGHFPSNVAHVLPTNMQVAAMALGSLDGKKPSFAIVGASKNALVYTPKGTGTDYDELTVSIKANKAANFNGVVFDDLNGDGRSDLAITSKAANVVAVAPQVNGAFPTFTEYSTAIAPFGVRKGSFGLSSSDLAVAASGAGAVTVLQELVVATASYGAASTIGLQGGTGPRSLEVGELDGDKWTDVVTSDETSNDVTVLLGTGKQGSPLAKDGTYLLGGSPRNVVLGDFDHDGNADIAVAIYGLNSVGVLLGHGDGKFDAVQLFPVPKLGPTGLVAADFDKDGKLDLAVTCFNAGQVFVLLNVSAK